MAVYEHFQGTYVENDFWYKTPPHSGSFPGVTLHILEIKKIYQHIVNYANLSVLKLEKRYLD